MTYWHALRVRTGTETIVRDAIHEDALCMAFVPVELHKLPQIKARRVEHKAVALFPGYVFVPAVYMRKHWPTIKAIKHVHGVVSNQGAWLGISRSDGDRMEVLMHDLHKQKGKIRERLRLKAGSRVRVTSGPFANHAAEIASIRGKVAEITVHLFGRPTEAKIELQHLQAVDDRHRTLAAVP